MTHKVDASLSTNQTTNQASETFLKQINIISALSVDEI